MPAFDCNERVEASGSITVVESYNRTKSKLFVNVWWNFQWENKREGSMDIGDFPSIQCLTYQFLEVLVAKVWTHAVTLARGLMHSCTLSHNIMDNAVYARFLGIVLAIAHAASWTSSILLSWTCLRVLTRLSPCSAFATLDLHALSVFRSLSDSSWQWTSAFFCIYLGLEWGGMDGIIDGNR